MNPPPRSFFEEFTVAGNKLVEKVKEILEQGNVRRVIIKDSTGQRTLLEVPLTLGVAAGAGLAWFAAPLAAIGAVAALVTQVRVIIERYEDPTDAEAENKGPTLIEIDED
ncbi:DUF4342 domain-containing protein [Candidatus Cyanaurora vandensis]|uniref:DUF4342 domain-containing protein n=1 Tax=Candidatus Cyanaurora vandensis TaxID=2714958 RepID=UPI00257A4279|nr:DUF4342 domain-containing protein [Candidatus Cyanaurora vandensis]